MSIISITKRTETGRKLEALRKGGRVPAVVYGPKDSPEMISLLHSDIDSFIKEHGEATVATIEGDGIKKDVLLHDVQFNPLSNNIEHIDFYVVDKTTKVTVSIPVELIGEAPAVKTEGGNLVSVLHEVEIESLPGDIPSELSVDVSVLKSIGDVIYAKDITLPKGVELMTDGESALAIIEGDREEEEDTGEAPSLDDIERVGEKKEEEEEN